MPLTRERIVEHLVDSHGIREDEIDDETLLFSSRLLDSFAMVELMTIIEKEAGIRMKPMEVTLDNLDSVARMIEYVNKKSAAEVCQTSS